MPHNAACWQVSRSESRSGTHAPVESRAGSGFHWMWVRSRMAALRVLCVLHR